MTEIYLHIDARMADYITSVLCPLCVSLSRRLSCSIRVARAALRTASRYASHHHRQQLREADIISQPTRDERREQDQVQTMHDCYFTYILLRAWPMIRGNVYLVRQRLGAVAMVHHVTKELHL